MASTQIPATPSETQIQKITERRMPRTPTHIEIALVADSDDSTTLHPAPEHTANTPCKATTNERPERRRNHPNQTGTLDGAGSARC